MVKELDRVKIWNSYLIEARGFANKLKKCSSDDEISTITLAGGRLSAEEHYIIMTIIHSVLAVDARANHLLHELEEKRSINKTLRNAVLRLDTKNKWALLPTLNGKENKISYDDRPHQAISELFGYRNQFIHVIYERDDFLDELPSKSKTIGYYNDFIEAMEDMNVLLGRHKEKSEVILKKLKV